MEAIKGLQEAIEKEFGESIVARDEATVHLASNPGLGPPDLCWMQKTPRGSMTGVPGEPRGFYHYVLGLEVSSSANVAAYFASVTQQQEPVTFLQVGRRRRRPRHVRRGCTWDTCTCHATCGNDAVHAASDPVGLRSQTPPQMLHPAMLLPLQATPLNPLAC